MSLSIIVASSGRRSLQATIDSIIHQLRPGDELLVDVNVDAPWGHAARNRMIPRARGEYLLFMDDDDMYVDGALHAIRETVTLDPDRIHVFKMRYPDGRELWRDPAIRCGNVSTQMIAVPNRPGRLGTWGNRYEGDFDFIAGCVELQPHPPAFHSEAIALIRP